MAPLIARWEPEDRGFWLRDGAAVAQRNLTASIPALMLSFAVWMLWSVVVVELPRTGFRFSANQLFWLAAVPGLAGATLRLLFSFMVPVFGGRTWTVASTLALLVPTVGLGIAVQDPTTGYPTFLLLAVVAGVGGGNFASSMANVSFFFPSRRQGHALGLNAGLGNLGVGLAQLVVPLAIGVSLFGAFGGGPQLAVGGDPAQAIWLQNAGYVWVPFIAAAALVAWRRMDDLQHVRASIGEQAVVFRRPHTWLLAWLYLGSFGSFVGFAAGFPLVTEFEFAGSGLARYAFVGPLLAAFARPAGGWFADQYGGGRVALGSFVAMSVVVAALIAVGSGSRMTGGEAMFLSLFALLFIASGIANGAVFQLVPAVFAGAARRSAVGRSDRETVHRRGALEGAAALGLASGIAALGGFFIPKAYGTAIALTGDIGVALVLFLVFYLSCTAVTWWCYVRPHAEAAC